MSDEFDENLKRVRELVATRQNNLDRRWADFTAAVSELADLARRAGYSVTSDWIEVDGGSQHSPPVEGRIEIHAKAVGFWIPNPFGDGEDDFDPSHIWLQLEEVDNDYRLLILRNELHNSLATSLISLLQSDVEAIKKPIGRASLARPEPEVLAPAQELGWVRVLSRWRTAVSRAMTQPDQATTAARSLLEDVAKHILDAHAQEIPPDLKRATRTALEILGARSKINEKIRGGLQTLEQAVLRARNTKGDAHGSSPTDLAPTVPEAHLYVSIAGAMSAYLMALHLEQQRLRKGQQ